MQTTHSAISKSVITFGEIMMRLSVPGLRRLTQAETFNVTYGGAEANVSISLSRLGIPSTHVTRLPDNDLGTAVVEYLRGHGVSTSHIIRGNERLGIYVLENGAMHRAPKIIYDRFNSAFANIRAGEIDWTSILQNASWFHWTGITAAISQTAADACLEAIRIANKIGVPVSGDINYRRNLWQYGKSPIDVMPMLIEGTQYIVAGTQDIENCLGISSSKFEEACAEVIRRYPHVKRLAQTRRETISASHNKIQGTIFDGSRHVHSREYDISHIVDRVGAGDAFMAGLIYGWLKKTDEQKTVEFAAAACALKHSIEGDANVVSLEEIEALMNDENTGKLLR